MAIYRLKAMIACGLFSTSFGMFAQGFDPSVAVGIPTTVMHGSQSEHVDLMSGALQISIPLVHLRGRGIDLDIDASYSSKVWSTRYLPDPYNTTILAEDFGGTSQMGNGWSIGVPKMTANLSGGIICETDDCQGGRIELGQVTRMDGSTESITNSEPIRYNGPPPSVAVGIDCTRVNCGVMTAPFATWSYDGSYNIQADGEFLKDGTHIYGATSVINNRYITSQTIEDTNGNYIQCYPIEDYSPSSCSDTLGRTVQFNANYGPPHYYPQIVTSLNYPDQNGAQQTILLTYQTMNISYVWAQADGPQCSTNAGTGFCVSSEGTAVLLTGISLPGNGAYSFEYNLNSDGTTSGELSKLTYPTGGYVRYTYMNLDPHVADFIASNRRVSQRFVSPDGTAANEQAWTYNVDVAYPTSQNDPPATDTVSVIDPAGNIHSESFAGSFGGVNPLDGQGYPPLKAIPVSVQSKDVGPAGNLMQLVQTTYGYDSSSYAVYDPFVNVNNPRVLQTVTTLGGSSLQTTVTYQYGAFGNITQENHYDWAPAGVTGRLLRSVNKTYLADVNPAYAALNVHMVDRPATEQVSGDCGGTGTLAVCTSTSYTYDGHGSGRLSADLSSRSGTIQHDDTFFPSSNSLRGNVTQIAAGLGNAGGLSLLDKAYDQVGNVVAVEDGNQNVTLFGYSDNFRGPQPIGLTAAYITTVTKPPTNGRAHVSRRQYYLNSGLTAAVCGENFASLATCSANLGPPLADYAWLSYDGMNRVTDEWLGDGGHTGLLYNIQPLQSSVTESRLMQRGSGSIAPQVLTRSATFDGLGRVSRQIQANGATVDTTYDVTGRTASLSNPHFNTPSLTDGTTSWAYDALGRKTTQCNPDNGGGHTCLPGSSYKQWSYSGNTTYVTDEAFNTTIQVSDGLGRISTIVEPGSRVTSYGYDVLGNLTGVTQSGIGAEVARIRNFHYDSLSRLLWSSNPETGVICYGHGNGSASGCQADGYDNNDNLLYKTDARGLSTSYTYDALNRLTLKIYSDGTQPSRFGYDGFDPNGLDLASVGIQALNPVGRLTQASINNVGTIWSYDAMGRIAQQFSYLPSLGNYSTSVSAGYDFAGNKTDLTYPDGRHIHQTWNGAGELGQPGQSAVADANSGQQFVESVAYNADSSPFTTTFGNGVQQIVAKNNRLQVQSMTASTPLMPFNGQPFLLRSYSYVNPANSQMGNNGNIWGITDTLNGSRSQSFTYDALNRISSFSLGGVLNQQFQVDSFGNMSQSLGVNWLSCFDPANNRLNDGCSRTPVGPSPGPVPPPFAFDNAGNLTGDTDPNGMPRTYTYDAESRISSIAVSGNTPFETYTYNADGNRARKFSPADGTFTEYVNFNGQPVAERDQAGNWTDYIYANGAKVAKVGSSVAVMHSHGIRDNSINPACGSAWDVSTATALNGYALRPGDKMAFDQKEMTAHAGLALRFSDGTASAWTPSVADSNGDTMTYSLQTDGQWHHRVFDLSPFASQGKLVTGLIAATEADTPMGTWDVYYQNVSIFSTDGLVMPLFTGQPVNSGLWSPCGGNSLSLAEEQSPVTDPGAATHYFLADHLGSAQMEFAAGGWPVWQGQFAPFGGELINGAPLAPNLPDGSSSHYKFTGKERDSESGLDYFGARYYASSMGRWMSPDWADKPEAVPYSVLGDPQSLNLYGYVRNNPLSRSDADGHCEEQYCPGNPSPAQVIATLKDDGLKLAGTPIGQGIGKIALGIGLVVTAAGGDIPGGTMGAILVVNTVLGGVSSVVSGVTDIVGGATHTDVAAASQALSATSNLGGLVTTAATGSLAAGQVAATATSAATLVRNPAGAARNPATMIKAGKTITGVASTANKAIGAVQSLNISTPTPPPLPPPPPPPPCSVVGACRH